MATFEKPKPSERLPSDLLPVIYESGVLSERQFADIRDKVVKGEYPDEPNALAPFEQHPEMVLKRTDIASFVANWHDKASNIRAIAEELNIGLDSLVFVDDNPFERSLVRRELPMVAVPEVGDDPATFAQTLADAGYFETVTVTEEDRVRTEQYQGNRRREQLKASTTDLDFLSAQPRDAADLAAFRSGRAAADGAADQQNKSV